MAHVGRGNDFEAWCERPEKLLAEEYGYWIMAKRKARAGKRKGRKWTTKGRVKRKLRKALTKW